MKKYAAIALLAATLFCGACSTDKRATELLETARFEEKQNNLEHAVKLYDEIVRKFPKTPAANEAAARLKELQVK